MPRRGRRSPLGTKGSVSEDMLQARAVGGFAAVQARPRRKGVEPDLAGTIALIGDTGQAGSVDEMFEEARILLEEVTTRTVEDYLGSADDRGERPRRYAGARSLKLLMLAPDSMYGRVTDLRSDLATALGYTFDGLQRAEELVIDDIARLVIERVATRSDAPDFSEAVQLPRRRPTLAGIWYSRYEYTSTDAPGALYGEHYVVLAPERGWLRGRSRPHTIASVLELDLRIDSDSLLTGFWTERTSTESIYFGAIQLLVDPLWRTMEGKWVGFNRRYAIGTGDWQLRLVEETVDEESAVAYDFRL